MIACRLVGRFVETPDEVLENEAHGDVVHPAGMEVDLRELRDHEIMPVGLLQLLDFLLELEALEDFANVLGKTSMYRVRWRPMWSGSPLSRRKSSSL